MPQLKIYTGKILRTTVDTKEIRKFMKDNELEEAINPNEIIRIRLHAFKIVIPPGSYKQSSLYADLLYHGSLTALSEIFEKDLIEFAAYTAKAPKNGYTILHNYPNCEEIKRIQKDPFKPIFPIRYYFSNYFSKVKNVLLNPIAAAIISILGIIVTIVFAIMVK